MADPITTTKEQFDRTQSKVVVSFPEDMDNRSFRVHAIPFAVGYARGTHGLTRVDYMDKTLTFKRLCDEETIGSVEV